MVFLHRSYGQKKNPVPKNYIFSSSNTKNICCREFLGFSKVSYSKILYFTIGNLTKIQTFSTKNIFRVRSRFFLELKFFVHSRCRKSISFDWCHSQSDQSTSATLAPLLVNIYGFIDSSFIYIPEEKSQQKTQK